MPGIFSEMLPGCGGISIESVVWHLLRNIKGFLWVRFPKESIFKTSKIGNGQGKVVSGGI